MASVFGNAVAVWYRPAILLVVQARPLLPSDSQLLWCESSSNRFLILVLENTSYHRPLPLFPKLTLIASLQLPVLTNGGWIKKARFLYYRIWLRRRVMKSNRIMTLNSSYFISPLPTHRIGDKEFFREIREKTALFLPKIKPLVVKISIFLLFFRK
jgi:hypothetical protein